MPILESRVLNSSPEFRENLAHPARIRLAALAGTPVDRAAVHQELTFLRAGVDQYSIGDGLVFQLHLPEDPVHALWIDELAVVGDPGDAGTRPLLARASRGFRPNQVLAASSGPDASAVALLHGRVAIDGQPTAYLCRDFSCRLPVTDPAALAALLEEAAA